MFIPIETGWAHSALTVACQSGHLRVVEVLLDDPEINVSEGEGERALEVAMEDEHYDLVKYLHKKLDIRVDGVV